jgi:hypothetical protein
MPDVSKVEPQWLFNSAEGDIADFPDDAIYRHFVAPHESVVLAEVFRILIQCVGGENHTVHVQRKFASVVRSPS